MPKLRLAVIFHFSLLIFHFPLSAQVTVDPPFPTVDDTVTIYFHADQGNGALAGIVPVYAHMGVITNLSSGPSDWKHVVTTWGTADPVGAMMYVAPNLWKKTIHIRTFFNIPANETVLKLAFVFRNLDGSIVGRAANGGDIYYDVYPANGPLQTLIIQPSDQLLLTSSGALIDVEAAASQSAILSLYDNGVLVASSLGTSLQTSIVAGAAGLHEVLFIASTASGQDTSSFTYIVPQNLPAQDPPAGTELGINYVNDQTVRLSLYAPGKDVVYVIGDFNDWQPGNAWQMRRGLDNATWWLEIGGLTPGQRYRFQYLVDGTLRIADPLSTLVLDQFNDPFIPSNTFPNLSAYPFQETGGSVSVLQTAQPAFNWQASGYQRPKKADLIIYELLVRDFIARHDYQTLTDTLDYLDRLGVTAIELMPVNEFDGNINWGYAPSFHKALDKYYGTAEALKTLIDACHQRGIAVILDVVFNHATGASPLAQLYWDAANNRPAPDNPWLNPVPKHEFNVFNDFNHESAATKAYVKNCLEYWLTEFRVDGFRFDLSKGFTQKNTLGSVSAWGVYDATRVAIWKDYADFMWAIDPETYVILEHFAENNEEKVLAEYGMMLWGNVWGPYKEVALGYPGGINTDLSWVSYAQRGWSVPHLVGYMESHDEDRIAFELKTYGNAVPGYNLKSLPTAMRRIEMLENLLYTVPGPKMLWQFGELGYDYTINYCPNGTVSPDCRTSPKPIRWDYFDDPSRRRLYDVTAALLQLRQSHDVFETTDFQLDLNAGAGRSIRLNSSDLNVHVIANVGVTAADIAPNFQHTGTWYEYYSGDSLLVSNTTAALSLGPGEYRLYLDEYVALPPGLNPTPVREISGPLSGLEVYPNPFFSTFAIEYELREAADLQLDVMDITGKTVQIRHLGTMPAGAQHLELNASDWPSAFYWLSIKDSRGARLTKKIIKI
jgi:hypothetical protein